MRSPIEQGFPAISFACFGKTKADRSRIVPGLTVGCSVSHAPSCGKNTIDIGCDDGVDSA